MSRKVDFVKLQQKLKPETWASVQSFRTRHAQLQKSLNELKDSSAEINFDAYKVLKNQSVVEEAKKALSSQKILKFHSEKQLKEIEKAREAAVEVAKKTEQSIQAEMSELKVLQKDIETARPIAELTVDDVAKAYPELDKTVEKMALRGQWRVPGYYEKYFIFNAGLVNLKSDFSWSLSLRYSKYTRCRHHNLVFAALIELFMLKNFAYKDYLIVIVISSLQPLINRRSNHINIHGLIPSTKHIKNICHDHIIPLYINMISAIMRPVNGSNIHL